MREGLFAAFRGGVNARESFRNEKYKSTGGSIWPVVGKRRITFGSIEENTSDLKGFLLKRRPNFPLFQEKRAFLNKRGSAPRFPLRRRGEALFLCQKIKKKASGSRGWSSSGMYCRKKDSGSLIGEKTSAHLGRRVAYLYHNKTKY